MARAADRAFSWIRTRIVDGRLAAGEHLREEEIAAEVGCSRTPVREAIRRLAADGMVEFVPNRGAHVATWSERNLAEIFELRAVLEGLAARRATAHADETFIGQLRELADSMEELAASDHPDKFDQISELNNRFHHAIVEAADNRRLTQMVSGLIQIPLVHRTFRRYREEEMHRSMSHHRELIAAFERGDATWAETVMRSHIYAARGALELSRTTGVDPS